ncbi:MFS transporter [Aureimonas jatrophae]|uniref:Predicted arabinose efflux permease, MFS family n=1 Tax=Aureimonas jatrophae TaxID=1166073 RepID=A0A1H0CFA9_9HYPH|nr:MFS transporter [Aureimonas jatrophae]MBB3949208.1 putative MFS family arabinose efflux permease [Aureimonas jatrophae]SDN56506.1 Predicted arabinose efflux permease, MFS family [Aureimonas jatrophae]
MSPIVSEPAIVRLSHGAALAMAITSGLLAANLYYAQPVVALIGQDLGMPPALESLIVTAAQIGYALGLVLLVPLGDVVENRRLILASMGACILGLVGLALAPAAGWLFVATLLVGLTSVGAQMIVPLAAHFAAPSERGRIVGNIMTGLLGGILLARPLSSFVAGLVGWRAIFWISAALLLVLAAIGSRVFPERRPGHRQSYGALIASLAGLLRMQPVLRRRAIIHAALFASFALFWTGAPLLLLGEPFHLSPQAIAVFALSGALGVLAAPVAGRLADRGHTRAGTVGALLLAAAAMALALVASHSLAALVIAGILLDLGVQANLVIGQREIFLLDGTIRNRLNAVFMSTFFLGGALGSALTSPLIEAFGWHAVALLGALFPLAALAYFLFGERRRAR